MIFLPQRRSGAADSSLRRRAAAGVSFQEIRFGR